MNITLNRENHLVRLTLQGEIDELAAEELKKYLRDVALTAPQRVELNFAAVTHIGSAGIGKLLVFYKDLAIHGAVLSLVRVPGPIYHLFREMKLDSIFSISEAR
jgi:anti-sigma B factor antagonist